MKCVQQQEFTVEETCLEVRGSEDEPPEALWIKLPRQCEIQHQVFVAV
jgi:hypothetical protein